MLNAMRLKKIKEAVIENCEEDQQNRFCHFRHAGATLLNKDKYQAYGMQFTDNLFGHDNAIALSFRKKIPISR